MSLSLNRPRPSFSAKREVVAWIGRALQRLAGSPSIGANELFEASKLGFEFRRQIIDGYLREHYGLTVQAGPFQGMTYIAEAAGSLFGPKILGSYELELAHIFGQLDRYETFVDVGCAEGYFAVGALVAAPHIKTMAFDLDPRARQLCVALAETNKVAGRLQVAELCRPEDLVQLAGPKTLIMIDIEGAETSLLGGTPAEALKHCDVVVETHYTAAGCTLEFLHTYFSPTHDITIIEQSARDPAAFPPLMALGQVDRFMAHWEGRGPEPWIFAQARR